MHGIINIKYLSLGSVLTVNLLFFYFDVSSVFDLFPNPILLHKLCAFSLSDGYVNRFCS